MYQLIRRMEVMRNHDEQLESHFDREKVVLQIPLLSGERLKNLTV